ncbi:urease accessory protein UreE [Halobellus rubicundus]|uniref:Urease accessory protein UreE n=1 Tax=Halobellus rubicundus TaxID=2996466 RepID=A0ABD5M724_9EURY
MRLADTYLGHRDEVRPDPDAALSVTLSDEERRRSRVRTETDSGEDIGIVVGETLADGDVLATDEGRPVLVSLASTTALVVDLADAVDADLTDALALGHAAGNRHWDLAVDGPRAYFPVTEDHERMEGEIRPLLPAGASIGYEDVSPALFDGDAPGTIATPDHSHSGAEAGHGHSHGGSRGHDHEHGHGDRAHGHDHSHGDHDHAHARDSPTDAEIEEAADE